MKKTIGLLLILFTLSLNAQTIKKADKKSNHANFGLNDFLKLDMSILNALPTLKDFKSAPSKISKLCPKIIRFVDSLDFSILKDTLKVKIYS